MNARAMIARTRVRLVSDPRRPESLDLGRAPALPFGLVFVGAWLALAWFGGGTEPSSFGPLGIVLVIALGVGIATAPRTTLLHDRWRAWMLAAVAAFVGWSFLSMVWADFPGAAWAGADRTLLIAVSLALPALWPWPPRVAGLLLALYGVGIAATAAFVLGRAALATDPDRYLESGRLIGVTGYVNGDVALWTFGALIAISLGSTTLLPRWMRPIALGLATLLLDVAVLGQSRGWLFAGALGVLLALLLARERLRMLVGLTLVGCVTLAVLQPLLEVYEVASEGTSAGPSLDRAALFTALAAVIVTLLGTLWVAFDGSVVLSPRAHRTVAVGAVAICLVGVGVGGALWLRSVDSPTSWVSERWDDFTRGYEGGGDGSRFVSSLGTDRYEQWRIAWAEFLDHPVLGTGVDNFAAAYLRDRGDNLHEPLYPHSVWIRLPSQLGVIGTMLFVAAIAIAVALALVRRRRLPPGAAGAVAASLTVAGYWAIHGAVDVFWEVPALAAPALGLLGLGSAIQEEAQTPPREPSSVHPRPEHAQAVLVALGSLACVAAIAALALPALSYAYAQGGSRVWSRDPQLAYDRLELAADLDPLSAAPLLVEGSIALRLGDLETAEEAFLRAAEREPDNWYAYLKLALEAEERDDIETALSWIARARSLNPRDPVVTTVERALRSGEQIDVGVVDELYGLGLNRIASPRAYDDLPDDFLVADGYTDSERERYLGLPPGLLDRLRSNGGRVAAPVG